MLLWFLEGDYARKWKRILGTPPALAVLVFVGVNALSLMWCSDPVAGLDYLSKYRYLLLVPMIATSLRPQYRWPALNALLIGVCLSLVWSYAMYFGWVHSGKGYPENPSPTMLHLDYSMFLAFAALMVLNTLVRRHLSSRQRFAWAVLLAYVTTGLFINIGRSGQLAFFGALLVITPTYLRGSAIRRVLVTTAAVGLALIAVYSTIPVFHDRVNAAASEIRAALVNQRYESNQGKRIAAMIVSAHIIRDHPVLGAGIVDNMDEFRILLDTRFQHLRDAVHWFPHLHNQYVQVTTEIGLVGLASLLAIFYTIFRCRLGDREIQSLAILLGCVYLFGFVGDPFLRKQLPLVQFATVLGILVAEKASVWWHQSRSASASSS